ncbi:hypothetical protein [Bradyrhizobium sp. LB13.1]
MLTAGLDNVERYGVPPGTVVTNAADAYSPAVAVHAVSLMLALKRQLGKMLSNQERRVWDRSLVARLSTLDGDVAAIIAFGSIGKKSRR